MEYQIYVVPVIKEFSINKNGHAPHGTCPFYYFRPSKDRDAFMNVYLHSYSIESATPNPVNYFASTIIISLLLAMNLVIASGESGACWIFARS